MKIIIGVLVSVAVIAAGAVLVLISGIFSGDGAQTVAQPSASEETVAGTDNADGSDDIISAGEDAGRDSLAGPDSSEEDVVRPVPAPDGQYTVLNLDGVVECNPPLPDFLAGLSPNVIEGGAAGIPAGERSSVIFERPSDDTVTARGLDGVQSMTFTLDDATDANTWWVSSGVYGGAEMVFTIEYSIGTRSIAGTIWGESSLPESFLPPGYADPDFPVGCAVIRVFTGEPVS